MNSLEMRKFTFLSLLVTFFLLCCCFRDSTPLPNESGYFENGYFETGYFFYPIKKIEHTQKRVLTPEYWLS